MPSRGNYRCICSRRSWRVNSYLSISSWWAGVLISASLNCAEIDAVIPADPEQWEASGCRTTLHLLPEESLTWPPLGTCYLSVLARHWGGGGCHCSHSLLFFHCNQPSDRKTKGKGVYLGSQFQKVPLMATWFCATCLTVRLTIMAGGACDQGHFFHLHEKRKPRARQEESRSMRPARTHLQRLLAPPRFYLLEFLEPSKTALLARSQTSNRWAF